MVNVAKYAPSQPSQVDDQIVFDEYVARNWQNREPITPEIIAVVDRLTYSSNAMAVVTCEELSLPHGTTYADGVRELKEWWAVR